MSGHDYANELERRFHSLPGLAQDALREPFTWINAALREVSGDPQRLLAAGSRYVQVAETVHELGQRQVRDRATLAERWNGEAHDAFDAAMARIEGQLDQVATAIRSTKEVLEVGAQACVEAANMIVDLVVGLLLTVASIWAVGVALSVLSLGATAAAAVAESIAAALRTVADVLRVLKVAAAILRRVAKRFVRLEALLRKLKAAFEWINAALKESQASVEAARGLSAKLGEQVSFSLQKAAVSNGIWLGTAGLVAMPSGTPDLYHGTREYIDGLHDAGEAEERAGQ